jgi:hypothetical protein
VSLRASVIAAVTLLAACGSTSVRPADEPEAIAPAPSPAPTTPVVDPEPAPLPSPAPEAPVDPSTEARADTATVTAGAELEIRRIGRWVSSGIKGDRRLVIREPQTWSRFWAELGAGVQPQVDFSRDLVIAVASGEQASGGHDIAVQRVTRTDGELRIEVVETSPGPNCMTTTALTQPVDVVQVESAGVQGWAFIDRTATSPC